MRGIMGGPLARCEQWLRQRRLFFSRTPEVHEPKLKDIPRVGDPFLSALPSGDCVYCGEHILGGEGCWYSVVDGYEVCSSGKSPTSFHEVRERKVV
jgi:hypothetical protein